MFVLAFGTFSRSSAYLVDMPSRTSMYPAWAGSLSKR